MSQPICASRYSLIMAKDLRVFDTLSLRSANSSILSVRPELLRTSSTLSKVLSTSSASGPTASSTLRFRVCPRNLLAGAPVFGGVIDDWKKDVKDAISDKDRVWTKSHPGPDYYVLASLFTRSICSTSFVCCQCCSQWMNQLIMIGKIWRWDALEIQKSGADAVGYVK